MEYSIKMSTPLEQVEAILYKSDRNSIARLLMDRDLRHFVTQKFLDHFKFTPFEIGFLEKKRIGETLTIEEDRHIMRSEFNWIHEDIFKCPKKILKLMRDDSLMISQSGYEQFAKYYEENPAEFKALPEQYQLFFITGIFDNQVLSAEYITNMLLTKTPDEIMKIAFYLVYYLYKFEKEFPPITADVSKLTYYLEEKSVKDQFAVQLLCFIDAVHVEGNTKHIVFLLMELYEKRLSFVDRATLFVIYNDLYKFGPRQELFKKLVNEVILYRIPMN